MPVQGSVEHEANPKGVPLSFPPREQEKKTGICVRHGQNVPEPHPEEMFQ
jgi:hypothetical protein